jgi:uncharacterized protein (DUF486 family)
MSAAKPQLEYIVKTYAKVLPISTFPIVPFLVAAIFQVFAWFGGRFLTNLTLFPRILVLWLFAAFEYMIQSPAMNAAQEVLGMQENVLIVLYNVATLVVFVIISVTFFKNKYSIKHVIALLLLLASIALVYL